MKRFMPGGRGHRPPSTGSWYRCFPTPLPPCNGLCDLGSVTATHFPKPHSSGSSLRGSLSPGDPCPERRSLAPGPVSGDSGHLSGHLHPVPCLQTLSKNPVRPAFGTSPNPALLSYRSPTACTAALAPGWPPPLSPPSRSDLSVSAPQPEWGVGVAGPPELCLLLTSPYQVLLPGGRAHTTALSRDPQWAETFPSTPTLTLGSQKPQNSPIPPSCHCPWASGETWSLNHYDAYPEATHQTEIRDVY